MQKTETANATRELPVEDRNFYIQFAVAAFLSSVTVFIADAVM